MNYLYWSLSARQGQIVEVTIDHATNVLLLTEAEFERFQRGMSYEYRGGSYTATPVRIVVPYHGWWHVVVCPGPVTATIKVLS
jgi:hypothetical protein